jgi:nicotinamide-nucleotide amidase
MQAEIITIGDEILIGHTIDTNSAWLGQKLNELGVEVVQIRSISDNREDIVQALNHLHPLTRLVLMTGGLGPTKDDLTKKTLADYFQSPLVFNQEVFAHIEALFQQLGRNISQLNREQAMVPEAAEPLFNAMGTAPGMRFKKGEVYIISMPGVPYEMKHIMSTHVLPWIEQELITSNILHKTILTQGVPESELAARIEGFEDQLPPEIKLAYLPSPGIVKLRLTARGQDRAALEALLQLEAEKLKIAAGSAVFAEDSGTLQEVIGQLLIEKGATLGTAESCTGGYIASLITQIPGSSNYFKGSVVAYANVVKE